MKNKFKLVTAVILLGSLVFVLCSEASAKKGKGKGHHKSYHKSQKCTSNCLDKGKTTASRPAGWDRGKKTGWRGGKYPPGWSKWSEKEKVKWTADREEAHVDIRQVMTTYNIPTRQQSQIMAGFDEAILGGVAVARGANKLVNGLKDPNQRKLLLINSTQNVLEYLK